MLVLDEGDRLLFWLWSFTAAELAAAASVAAGSVLVLDEGDKLLEVGEQKFLEQVQPALARPSLPLQRPRRARSSSKMRLIQRRTPSKN